MYLYEKENRMNRLTKKYMTKLIKKISRGIKIEATIERF